MRLSEAMMLGSATCKMVPCDWNSCAVGAAANAVGLEQCASRPSLIAKKWPWLDICSLLSITFKFDNKVCKGKMTYEQLVDFVRSIEPSCGECNQFECSCKPAEVFVEVPVEKVCNVEVR